MQKELTEDQQRDFRRLLGMLTNVSYSRTPLGPMVALYASGQPAEEIRIRKTSGGRRLRVTVNYVRRGISRRMTAEVPLSAAEWETLVRTIVTRRLLVWKPVVSEGQRFTKIDSLRLEIAGRTANYPCWFGAIDNPRPPESLRKLLVTLADEKLPHLPLYFLRPED